MDRLPPVVYAPTLREGETTRLKMQRMANGQSALFVYSAIDRLEAEYGEGHPWVLLTVPDLERAHQQVAWDLLLLDRALHPVGSSTGGAADE